MSAGRRSRRKGHTWERTVAAWMRNVWPDAARNLTGASQSDVSGTAYSVECKDQQRWSVLDWWRQAEEQAAADRRPPVLIIHRPGHASPDDALVVMRGADWLALHAKEAS